MIRYRRRKRPPIGPQATFLTLELSIRELQRPLRLIHPHQQYAVSGAAAYSAIGSDTVETWQKQCVE